jgi:hypothetical protein
VTKKQEARIKKPEARSENSGAIGARPRCGQACRSGLGGIGAAPIRASIGRLKRQREQLDRIIALLEELEK